MLNHVYLVYHFVRLGHFHLAVVNLGNLNHLHLGHLLGDDLGLLNVLRYFLVDCIDNGHDRGVLLLDWHLDFNWNFDRNSDWNWLLDQLFDVNWLLLDDLVRNEFLAIHRSWDRSIVEDRSRNWNQLLTVADSHVLFARWHDITVI